MFPRLPIYGQTRFFENISGNTSNCLRFGVKQSVVIASIDEFAQFLKNSKAISSLDAHQTTIIEIGKPISYMDMVKTVGTITMDDGRVDIVLYHGSFNYGIEANGENIIINLNGNEQIIPKMFFTKAQLAIAFGLASN
jgi:hypothetical protein